MSDMIPGGSLPTRPRSLIGYYELGKVAFDCRLAKIRCHDMHGSVGFLILDNSHKLIRKTNNNPSPY